MKTKAVQLFTVCVHHFLGCNYDYVYSELEKEFPNIDFYRCFMDPVMQKKGLTPDQKLRRSMFSKLPECEPKKNVVAIIGGDFPIDGSSDLMTFFKENNIEVRQVQTSKTYEDFLKISEAFLFIDIHPAGELAIRTVAKRLNREYLYLPASFDTDVINEQLRSLGKVLGKEIEMDSFIQKKHIQEENVSKTSNVQENVSNIELDKRIQGLKETIGNSVIFIDGTAHPRPLSLARFLLEHGIKVDTVFLDFINPEEEKDFLFLKENYPDLILSATMHVKKRFLDDAGFVADEYFGNSVSTGSAVSDLGNANVIRVAVGQKAAYFSRTEHFVNIVNGFGLWGYDGIIKMCDLIEDAYRNKKDTRDIVPRKGLGCESCVENYI
ncbi:MAG: nitrogenase [Lachnospiraceae bacterium]|nr:nitrogenase [Lachnospiraceae bacterium]